MKYKIIVQPDAKNDIFEAAEWYDKQRFELGLELILRINEVFEPISLQPLGFQKVFMNFRKIITKQFSYNIYYLAYPFKSHFNQKKILNTQ